MAVFKIFTALALATAASFAPQRSRADSAPQRSRTGAVSSPTALRATSMSLEEFLSHIVPHGPVRSICMVPGARRCPTISLARPSIVLSHIESRATVDRTPLGAAAIMEATSDSWLWTFSEKTMPSGKTLLTTKVPGETADDPPEFELHLDVDAAKSATLGVSPKTGGPIARILGADGAPLLTLLPAKDSAFVEKVVGKFGEEVTLERAAAV